jgi:hypothetical protein
MAMLLVYFLSSKTVGAGGGLALNLYCLRVRFYVLIETGKRALLLDLDLGLTVIRLGGAFKGFLLSGNKCGWAQER